MHAADISPMRIAVLGAGGLGSAAARMLSQKRELRLDALVDSRGFAFDPDGLDAEAVLHAASERGGVAFAPKTGALSDDPIGEIIRRAEAFDGVFLALPNLPNDFVPGVAARFAAGGYRGVMTDALKRTSAAERVLKLDELFKTAEIVYIVGCGATPGLLTAAANLAAQSFAEVESVRIWFGVGIQNWEAYRATIREDIAHMPGFDVESARRLTDEEVADLLDERGGKLILEEMEHADDAILEAAGVVSRDCVSVGGVVDTRSSQKPVSTSVVVTGVTFEGRRSSHTFTLGDETSMAANVCGPAFGYMKAGRRLHEIGAYGAHSSATVMPRFVR